MRERLERGFTYKYRRCLSWPSSGPKVPETLELPKSLMVIQNNYQFVEFTIKAGDHKKRKYKGSKGKLNWKDLQSNYMIVGVTSDMEPSAGIDQSRVPALKHVVWI